MPAPKHYQYDRDKLMETLRRSRGEIQHQIGPLYGKGGVAVLGKEIVRLIEDLGALVTGDRDCFRPKEVGLTGPSRFTSQPPEQSG